MFEWRENINPYDWDLMVSANEGHYLQSAQWGNSRRLGEHMHDVRWVAYIDGYPVGLVRFEERKILNLIKFAWVPRGPIYIDEKYKREFDKSFKKRLQQRGYLGYIATPWRINNEKQLIGSKSFTIFIDLSVGKEKLLANFDKQFRYGVRHAKKMGVVVERSQRPEDIKEFYQLISSISARKNFYLNTNEQLMLSLAERFDENEEVDFHLFLARIDGKLACGAFIAHCGMSINYIWGGVDRAFAKYNVGEAVQWGVMEWALSKNCKLYDLEGADPDNNASVYNFKKRMGGKLVVMPRRTVQINNFILQSIVKFIQNYRLVKIMNI